MKANSYIQRYKCEKHLEDLCERAPRLEGLIRLLDSLPFVYVQCASDDEDWIPHLAIHITVKELSLLTASLDRAAVDTFDAPIYDLALSYYNEVFGNQGECPFGVLSFNLTIQSKEDDEIEAAIEALQKELESQKELILALDRLD